MAGRRGARALAHGLDQTFERGTVRARIGLRAEGAGQLAQEALHRGPAPVAFAYLQDPEVAMEV
ncbi:hypothetical protein ABZ922_42485 [Streptomyces shenzhenensis]|uniref:hypothetical protein n=1 Tax=Streptomyces shenzhenensis TaxID=943815 RepID=UPI0033DA9CA4